MKTKLMKYAAISLSMTMSVLFYTGCSYQDILSIDISSVLSAETYEKDTSLNDFVFQDNDSLYEYTDDVKVLYITVGMGTKSDGTDHTWDELYSTELDWYDKKGIKPYLCESVVQFGNEDGPVSTEYGFGAVSYNSTIGLTGSKSSSNPQKNIKINIKDGSGNVDGMKSFTLTKSYSDPFRFTNKLCYSLLEDIPGQLSVRNSFVHVYIKDVTESTETKFVDYGLYTMVETVNKRYLKNRGIDNSGEFYKINDFDWARHEDVILQPTDFLYSEELFNQYLESKGRNDYSNLLKLLDDVNNYSIPIEDIVEKYFDEENLYYWMAFNILVDNKAIGNENYYIYNPIGTEKFYFISWDIDAALRNDYWQMKNPDENEGWRQGEFIFGETVLFDRIMQSEHCINELSEAVDILHEGILSPENVSERANELAAIAKDYVYAFPDRLYARATDNEYDMLVEKLAEQMNANYYTYYDSIESPWPVNVYVSLNDENHVIVTWDESFGLRMDITYTLLFSTSWEFNRIIVHEDDLTECSYDIGELAKGQYFIKLESVSSNGNRQISKEFYNTEKKTSEKGVMCFYVLADGSVEKSTFED